MQPSYQTGEKHCNGCGHCCRAGTCHLVETDVPRIATHLGITPSELARDYLEGFKPAHGRVAVKPRMTLTGCVFLKGNDCGIQAVKPKGGVDYECWSEKRDESPAQYWWPKGSARRIGVVVERR
jgi:Fe-S-cluster containining protein